MDRLITREDHLELLSKVRTAAQVYPEVTEAVDGFGHTSFRVKNKPFIMLGASENGMSCSIKTSPETQSMLLQGNVYTRTPYIGQHGWVTVYLSERTDWKELKDLIEEAYHRTAPPKLRKLHAERQERT
ncbi:MmcQ/YjbR family DNA-binding protein [Paenibacillus gansuensis]|uniref:MmcQ/YjbR family DNA-binding protein n=1 Tax=Paenibacillus gansuensis TaxID=306542 RepID=A0ABW5PB85_9BACL